MFTLPVYLLTIPTYIPTDCQPPTMVQLAHPKTPEGLGTKNSTAWDKSSHYLLVFVVSDSLVALCIKCGQSVKLSTYLDVWLCTLFTYPRELSAACSSPTGSLLSKPQARFTTTLPEKSELTSGLSYKHFTMVNYDSRVVPDWRIPHITTLES